MLGKRIVAALVLALIGIPAIILGGYFYFVLITLFLCLAAWEYGRMFGLIDLKVIFPLLVGGVGILSFMRTYLPGFAASTLSLLILAAMVFHLLGFEKGRDKAASDFTVTVTGLVYLGWIGPYLIEVRNLPDGLWWLLLVLPAVWLADTGAYFFGKRFGKHLLCKRLSPKKTWEGYIAGVFAGTILTAGLSLLWGKIGGLSVPILEVAILAAIISILATFGDLGISMLKRQTGVKDTGNILPGHGGILDRMDSWIWAAVLGYFVITWFFI